MVLGDAAGDFHKLLGNFLATFHISSNFSRFEKLFAFCAISSFLQILRCRSRVFCSNWPCFHILQCFSGQFCEFPEKKKQFLPLGHVLFMSLKMCDIQVTLLLRR